MATAKPKTDVQALKVSTVKGTTSFRRAGMSFTKTPTLIPMKDLKEDQVKALKDEPLLRVEEVTELDDEAKAAIQSGAGE